MFPSVSIQCYLRLNISTIINLRYLTPCFGKPQVLLGVELCSLNLTLDYLKCQNLSVFYWANLKQLQQSFGQFCGCRHPFYSKNIKNSCRTLGITRALQHNKKSHSREEAFVNNHLKTTQTKRADKQACPNLISKLHSRQDIAKNHSF